jgi:hypothetical protein
MFHQLAKTKLGLSPPKMKDCTQVIHLGENPFMQRVCKRNGHLTLLYAFSKPIFKMTPLSFFGAIHVWFHAK